MKTFRQYRPWVVFATLSLLLAFSAGMLLLSPQSVDAIESGDPEKVIYYYDADDNFCGEEVWWCDGSYTNSGDITCPFTETFYYLCPGDEESPRL